MSEPTYRLWSAIIQVITALGVLYGIVSGLSSWNRSLSLEEVRLRNELLSAFWSKRIEAHIDAAAAAAILARANREDDSWKKAETTFWELYQGRLVVVESGDVCQEMVKFGNHLRAFESDDRVTQSDLEKDALSLAKVIRNALRDASEKREPIPAEHNCS